MNEKQYTGPSVNPVLDSIVANDPMRRQLADAQEQLVLKDKKIDHITDACIELEQQLTTAQADNRRLREALEQTVFVLIECGAEVRFPETVCDAKQALSLPTDASALDRIEAGYQARIKELEGALQTFIDEHEECTDADDWLAMTCSMESYHVADEALSTPADTSALDRMIAEEREACAKVCEEHPDGLNMFGGPFVTCATAIRARSSA